VNKISPLHHVYNAAFILIYARAGGGGEEGEGVGEMGNAV
jgi:hypothetical protein